MASNGREYPMFASDKIRQRRITGKYGRDERSEIEPDTLCWTLFSRSFKGTKINRGITYFLLEFFELKE